MSEWQTRQTQNLLWATTCGFKSRCRQYEEVTDYSYLFIFLILYLILPNSRFSFCIFSSFQNLIYTITLENGTMIDYKILKLATQILLTGISHNLPLLFILHGDSLNLPLLLILHGNTHTIAIQLYFSHTTYNQRHHW